MTLATAMKKQNLAIKKENKKIEDRNAKFNAMTIPQQRVAMGKEILSLIEARKVSPTRGVYFEAGILKKSKDKVSKLIKADRHGYSTSSVEWQKLLPDLKECRVCALGIAAYASIALRDGAALNHFGTCN